MSLPQAKPTSLEVLPSLREAFGPALRPELRSVRVIHELGKVILEIDEASPKSTDPDEKLTLRRRLVLDFILNFQTPRPSVFDDARALVEDFGAYSIANTLPLFTPEAEHVATMSTHSSDSG